MPLIDVIRSTPPELSRCRAAACNKAIEWVRVVATDRRMPVDVPLRVEREYARFDGSRLTTIDSKYSHFATCPEAATFRRNARAHRR